MDEGNILVINHLVSDSTTDALSANQGRVLNEKIETIQNQIEDVATDEDIDAIFTASN